MFDRVEPIGGPAMDYRAGALIQAVIRPNLREGAVMPDPLDFFPWTAVPEPILLSADEMLAQFDRTFR